MGTVPESYYQFVMDYAPYVYVIPPSTPDPAYGRGVLAASFAIDFLCEAYSAPQFKDRKAEIYAKTVSLADWVLTQQCTDPAKKAYGGFKSAEESTYYYSVDACRAIPSLLSAYELTSNSSYLDAAKIAGGTFLKTMQDQQAYGGFTRAVTIGDAWLLQLDVECLYGLIGLKLLSEKHDSLNFAIYNSIISKAIGFLRTGFENLWLNYDPADGKWHRVGLTENEVYDDPFAYALLGLYAVEGWSVSCQKVYNTLNNIRASAKYPAYDPAVCWAGYIDVVSRFSACDYYDAVTSGILWKIRSNHDKPSLRLSVEVIGKHAEEFMYWGAKHTGYSFVENKQAIVTVCWLAELFLHYEEPVTQFTKILKSKGETVTLYPVREAAATVAYGEPLDLLAVISSLKAEQVMIEAGYYLNDYLAFYTFIPVRQTGKSFIVSGLVLKYAIEHPNSYIAIVGPSWRQTKLNVRRIGGFARKYLGCERGIQKTRVSLPNGSVIEAFPNNPDTIRGPAFHVIWWEECNFTANDEDLYDAILFTLGTTNGRLIATSTPWSTDSLFWKMCNHKDYSDFGRTHISWQQALEPDGPLKPAIIEKIKRQFGDDPARWRREMEAEWAEDEDVWLAQSLIVACVGTEKNCGEDLEEFNPNASCEGDFFVGLDLAQTRDYCVLSVVERLNDKLFLRHLKIFQQPTLYAHVLGYLKALQDRWGGFQKIRVDFTREGPSIIADMENAGIENAEGVNFSVPRKSEMASLLKQRMMNKQFYYPLLNWERPYRGDLCTELNVERYDLRKDGAIGYSHPNGTHDDVFWSIALAVFATVQMEPEPFLTVIPR